MLISPAQAAVISGYQQPGPSWQQTSRQADRLLVDFVNTTLRSSRLLDTREGAGSRLSAEETVDSDDTVTSDHGDLSLSYTMNAGDGQPVLELACAGAH